MNKIIETISNETLDLLFDNNPNLNEDIEEHSLLNDDDDNKSENLKDIILENKSSDDDQYLNIEEFYPQNIKKR